MNDLQKIKFDKLDKAVEQIIFSKDDSFMFYLSVISELGTFQDSRDYGYKEVFKNEFSGLWQEPFQFASLLSFLSQQKIESYCEIGTFQCWTLILIAAVLKKKNNITVTGIDLNNEPEIYIKNIFDKYNIDFDFILGTSDIIKEQKFDLVMIDGDHSFLGVENDWMNLGRHAKITIFHDINDSSIMFDQKNAPKKVFDHIDAQKITILSDDYIMGFGIVFNYI